LVWAPQSVLARFLSSPPMMLLGESAYAFYLWHQTIVRIVDSGGTSTTAWAVTWLIGFLITTLVAVGSHLLVELPARTWLRRRLAGQGPPTTVTSTPS
jgi:peptidoglycan/LPS O-acetylase OafA/YrhL